MPKSYVHLLEEGQGPSRRLMLFWSSIHIDHTQRQGARERKAHPKLSRGKLESLEGRWDEVRVLMCRWLRVLNRSKLWMCCFNHQEGKQPKWVAFICPLSPRSSLHITQKSSLEWWMHLMMQQQPWQLALWNVCRDYYGMSHGWRIWIDRIDA